MGRGRGPGCAVAPPSGGGAPPRGAPSAGSIRHLSRSPWRPRTERGSPPAGRRAHGTRQCPTSRRGPGPGPGPGPAKWKKRYNPICAKSIYSARDAALAWQGTPHDFASDL
ncbi:hypothetical protein EVAR_4969_1 [Eumeta japonica]|uniref:Uncharacterized protein n=1 Tax=Eumeta variegata TaxID=151549 RepID=A0A4C1UZ10_EUMVA|nr:hypothetical protein EVAR_4969_1 [Eumeta japonica]